MTQGRLFGGRYELGELIGYGGMAEVHRGRDARLGREVAIKMLRADLARDPSFLNRFRREAQAAAGLNHPAIVSVYDTGEDTGPDGTTQPYIVMEFVAGRTLRDVLKAEGQLPARRVMEIGADICGALDFSHRNGIVHRDIKPANVMITPTGAVKVMDFGIARALADNSATVTQTANVIGTAQYLSPEQARGEAVDARSDVYSTGCLLYELATGSPPFQGDSPVAVAYQHVRENATAPSARNPAVPPALDSVVMKALAKNQLNRYQTAGEMRTDLQRALANQPVDAEAVMSDAERTQFIARTPLPPVALGRRDLDEPVEPDHARRAGLIWLAIVVAMLLVIGGVVALVVVTRKDGNTVQTKAVPAFVGQPASAVTAALTRAGFANVSKGDDTNGPCAGGVASVPTGTVCTLTTDQVPGAQLAADQRIDPNSAIQYHLFTPATVTVPSVIGLQYADAATKIHDAQLTPVRKAVDAGGTAGQVVDQNPAQFKSVPPGSSVTLSVTSGDVKLPNVKGLAVGDAQAKLNTAGFTNIDASQTAVTHQLHRDGKVADETPTPEKAYSPDTKITLIVFKYEKLPPTCTTPQPSTGPAGSTEPSSGASNTTGTATGAATTPNALPPCTK
jgi:eukaryotic-like serine/threonine-protein kinase